MQAFNLFIELHSPEHVFADAFLIFEKVLTCGVKDLYFAGDPVGKPFEDFEY